MYLNAIDRSKDVIRRLVERLVYLFFGDIRNHVVAASYAIWDRYASELVTNNGKYQHEKSLMKHGYRVCSEHNEDGIIREIFERVGVTNKTFVEFGVGDGSVCNSLYLLMTGWRGYWIECNPNAVAKISNNYKWLIGTGHLTVKKSFLTAENIESIFLELSVPKEVDLLSIDVDGNDYWIWKAIGRYNPRVVVIEYNAMFPPPNKWVMSYNPDHKWDGTAYAGASLKSLEVLGTGKGYSLVGCDFSGTNAFFVRSDLAADRFVEPFSAENHYEPPRKYMPIGLRLTRIDKFEII